MCGEKASRRKRLLQDPPGKAAVGGEGAELQGVLMPGMLRHTGLVGNLLLKHCGFMVSRLGFYLSVISWKDLALFCCLSCSVLLEFLTLVNLSEIPALQMVQTGAPAPSSERLQLREVSGSTFSSWCRNHCSNTAFKICNICGNFTWLCTSETRKMGNVRKSESFLFLKALCKAAAMVKKGNDLLHLYFCPKQILFKSMYSIAQQFLPCLGIIV